MRSARAKLGPIARCLRAAVGHLPRATPAVELWLLLAVGVGLASVARLEQVWITAVHPSGLGVQRDMLDLAVERGDENSVRDLLRRGVPINVIDDKGLTPLIRAAQSNGLNICRMLLDHGADADLGSDTGTALWVASCQDAAVTELLLRRGADPNKGSRTTTVSPLGTACLLGRAETVRLLIEAGADASACGSNAFTPLMAAAVSGRFGIVRTVLDAGGEIAAVDDEGNTPLHYAALALEGEEQAMVITLLLDHEAPLKVRNHAGLTPLDIAWQQQNQRAVELLERGY